MAKRRCLDCGALCNATRCTTCTQRRQATSGHDHRYNSTWRKHSRELRQAWVNQHGWNCPGYPPTNHPPHPTTDLVVDHDAGVMCRQANSAKAALIDRDRGAAKPGSP